MRKQFKSGISLLIAIYLSLAPRSLGGVGLPVFAASSWSGLEDADVATFSSIETLFGNVLSVALRLMGIVAFVMIVVGGIKFLVSGGDAKATDSARQTITYGIIGLVMVILSYLILTFIGFFTGIPDLLQFNVGI